MGTGLLVDAVHNVARAFTTDLLMWVCIYSPKTWNKTHLFVFYMWHYVKGTMPL